MDERLRVLKLLEEKKISVDEALRLLNALSRESKESKESMKERMEEEFSDIEMVIINSEEGDIELKEGDVFYVDCDGEYDFRREGKNGIINLEGDAEIIIKKGKKVFVSILYGDIEAYVSNDFACYSNYGDIELFVLEPINIDIKNSYGDTEVIYFKEPYAEFELEAEYGDIDNEFEFSKGEKKVRIKNLYGDIEIRRK
jgi:DUF4097 and DUF4098 domain-containing protein YvlB